MGRKHGEIMKQARSRLNLLGTGCPPQPSCFAHLEVAGALNIRDDDYLHLHFAEVQGYRVAAYKGAIT